MSQQIDKRDLIVSKNDGVALVTLNRPSVRNALSNALFYELIDTFEELETDREIGAILLTGAGQAFCAGGDVGDMPGDAKTLSFDERVEDLRRRADLIRQISESSKITIAAINGAAAGAGLSLALACDFRIAGASAKFITAFIRMGLSGDCGCIHQLTHLVGASKAKEMCFLSDPLSGEEALAIGLVNRCVPDEQLFNESMSLAARLARGPFVAQRHMKQNFAQTHLSLREALHDEAVRLIHSAHSEDHLEAKRAFTEKRPAVFVGR